MFTPSVLDGTAENYAIQQRDNLGDAHN